MTKIELQQLRNLLEKLSKAKNLERHLTLSSHMIIKQLKQVIDFDVLPNVPNGNIDTIQT